VIEINTGAILLGLAIGLPISVLFFWGLNWAMQMALASLHPGRLLLLSFFIRLAVLLGIGFSLAALTQTLWSLAGYMLAFLLIRIWAVLRAKISLAPDSVKQERG